MTVIPALRLWPRTAAFLLGATLFLGVSACSSTQPRLPGIVELGAAGLTRGEVEKRLPRGTWHHGVNWWFLLCGGVEVFSWQEEAYALPGGAKITVVYHPLNTPPWPDTRWPNSHWRMSPGDKARRISMPWDWYGRLAIGNNETVVTGRVITKSGQPWAGQRLRVRARVRNEFPLPPDWEPQLLEGSTRTMADGSFRFVLPGTYSPKGLVVEVAGVGEGWGEVGKALKVQRRQAGN